MVDVSTPLTAATVVVVRDSPAGLECWVMQRSPDLAFAPNAIVFPGGRMDAADAETSCGWEGPPAEVFADRMGVDAATARQIVTAAARELFEEAGILLATPRPAGDLAGARRAVEDRELTLGTYLDGLGSALDTSRLLPWCRIVTPPTRSRRYDTWFFALADGSVEAAEVSSEGVRGNWVRVERLLELADDPKHSLLPPTLYVLRSLAAAQTVEGVRAAADTRRLGAIHPQVHRAADGRVEVDVDGVRFPARVPAPRPTA